MQQPIKDFKNFQFLTPKDNLSNEEFEIYEIALENAINNKNVRNIAITGSYGAGKTSVLDTFFKKEENNISDLKFPFKKMRKQNKLKYKNTLNISLAFFDNPKTVNSENENNDEETNTLLQNNIIEKGVLKQLTYRLENKKTPKSRFKAIEKYKLDFNIPISLFSLFITIFIIIKYGNLSIKEIINTNTSYSSEFIIPLIIVVVIINIIIYIITHYIIQNIITLKKFKINNKFTDTSLEFDKESDSIFDKYLDEIIYYFEVSKTDIVIFEDLERFNNIDIFIKLREINQILNNNKRINKKIIFIYAIRDDIFENYLDRTKFFDFIIPIIPVLDSFNSEEILKGMIKHTKEVLEKSNNKFIKSDNIFNKFDNKFIKEIASYFKSMRILKNVFNEFFIHIGRLKNKLDKFTPNDYVNLFTFITYKNLYHKDFVKFQKNNGELHKAIQKGEYDSDNLLIKFIIKDLKIDNDYGYYLSSSTISVYFSENDRKFIKEVKNSKQLELTYELENPLNIINNLDAKYFKNLSILNYDLVIRLSSTQKNDNKKENLFNQLIEKNNRNTLKKFIERYKENPNNKFFIKELIKYFVKNQKESKIPYEELKNDIKKENIIKYADVDDIIAFDKKIHSLETELLKNIERELPDQEAIKLLNYKFNSPEKLNGIYEIENNKNKSGFFYMINKNSEVIYLAIKGKELKEIPKLISNFKNLLQLDLSNNKIEKISSLKEFENLISLNVSGNKNLENLYDFKNLIEYNGDFFQKNN